MDGGPGIDGSRAGMEWVMKVRIGIGSGGGSPTELADLVDRLEKLEVDLLWLSEHLSTPAVDPLVGMAFALGRTSQLKVGTGVAVLPGRNPVLLAKQLSSLALLAPRRVLPVLGLGPARLEDRSAFPLPEARGETRPAGTVGRRGAVFDEALEVLRRLLREPQVTFHGEFFDFTEISIGELPTRPLEIWLGGSTPAALRRIDDDHFGLSLRVAFEPPPAEAVEALRRRFPDSDPALVLPVGWATTRKLIGEYIAVGVSKFVIHPFSTPGGWPSILDSFAAELMPLEN